MTADANLWRPREDRRIYVLWLSLAAAGIVVGFGGDVARYMGEHPAPPLILHLHGLIYTVWLALVAAQIGLVETNRVPLHRRLGWATAIVGAMMVPLGAVAALVDEARRIHQPDSDPQFLALEFGDMIAFAATSAAGVIWRRRLAAHKRLMILSVLSLTDAGFSRIVTGPLKVSASSPFTWWMIYFGVVTLIILAMMGWDLARRRRVHPALLGGASFLWTVEAGAAVLQYDAGWKALMTSLVKAWGWVG